MTTLTFMIDVDNTLIANDEVKKDLDKHLKAMLGPKLTEYFWKLYEQARHESGVVDIPLALARLREEIPLSEMDEQKYSEVHALFDNYPYCNALYPHVIETLKYLGSLGCTVIVSDGDKYFQPAKIVRSEIAEAVDGRVLIYTHKQEHLTEVTKLYAADHYVIIDDKPKILVDAKAIMGDRLTTAFVDQGKYAHQRPPNFKPDISVLHIGDLRNYSKEQFLKA